MMGSTAKQHHKVGYRVRSSSRCAYSSVYLGDFLKRTSLVVVHGSVDGLLASPQRGEVGGGNTWTVSSPTHRRLRDHPPPGLPPLGGGHTPQHGVGGRRSGVEMRGEPFPEITLDVAQSALAKFVPTHGGLVCHVYVSYRFVQFVQ